MYRRRPLCRFMASRTRPYRQTTAAYHPHRMGASRHQEALKDSETTQTLISTSTPLGSSSFISASIVFGVEL